MAWEFFTIWRLYSRNEGRRASLKQTAFAAIMCISGPPCMPGKIGVVDLLGILSLTHDHPAARTPQGLVGGGGDKVRDRDRARGSPRCTQPAMWAISTITTASTLSAICLESEKVYNTRVGACTQTIHFRPSSTGHLLHCPIINGLGLPEVHSIMDRPYKPAAKADRMPVGQMSAMGKAHPIGWSPCIHDRKVYRHFGLGAGMGLDISMVCAEQFFGPSRCKVLDDIHRMHPP